MCFLLVSRAMHGATSSKLLGCWLLLLGGGGGVLVLAKVFNFTK